MHARTWAVLLAAVLACWAGSVLIGWREVTGRTNLHESVFAVILLLPVLAAAATAWLVRDMTPARYGALVGALHPWALAAWVSGNLAREECGEDAWVCLDEGAIPLVVLSAALFAGVGAALAAGAAWLARRRS